jgi:hypothetical protein
MDAAKIALAILAAGCVFGLGFDFGKGFLTALRAAIGSYSEVKPMGYTRREAARWAAGAFFRVFWRC